MKPFTSLEQSNLEVTQDLLNPIEPTEFETVGHRIATTVITEAMRAATPEDERFRAAYRAGAYAAGACRVRPAIVMPEDPQHTVPMRPDDGMLESRNIVVEDMPYMAHPTIELIREMAPDMVFAGDRGARMFALAVHQGWHRRYPGTSFPTMDGSIHFGRISKKIGLDNTRLSVLHVLHRSGVMAEMAQRQAEGSTKPMKILYLDDWVHGGTTVKYVQDVLQEEAARFGQVVDFRLGMMRGKSHPTIPCVTGDPRNSYSHTDWTDQGHKIGVDYEYDNPIRPVVIRTAESRTLRQRVREEIEKQISPAVGSSAVRPDMRNSASPALSQKWYRRLIRVFQ